MNMRHGSIRLKATSFGKLSDGGHLQIREAIDFPGVEVVSIKKNYANDWVQKFLFREKEFPTITAAIAAWRLAKEKARAGSTTRAQHN